MTHNPHEADLCVLAMLFRLAADSSDGSTYQK